MASSVLQWNLWLDSYSDYRHGHNTLSVPQERTNVLEGGGRVEGGTLHSTREMIYLTTKNIPFLGARGFIGSPLFGGAYLDADCTLPSPGDRTTGLYSEYNTQSAARAFPVTSG
ncbi:hypothetical protein KQX54_005568 [Cotesia glomerata]|uniref:Uncharacterized protein n=1 Tax=Cotesia glomerata TaxID=32391 RepID=A0AAV7I5S1_COTGL|nr:hypothetical protein KQX54_005568 [Cotesia glomerata]